MSIARRAVSVSFFTLALSSFVQCGSSESAGPDGTPKVPDTMTDASSTPPGTTDGGTTEDGGENPPPKGCEASDVQTFADCIDHDTPDACTAKIRPNGGLCDFDHDDLDDALEDAMLKAYAPVFAYNRGDGGHTAGNDESAWPVSAAHFVSHAQLIWRIDNDDSTRKDVDTAPTLSKLAGESFVVDGKTHLANSPVLGEGPNFWLCLKKSGSDYEAGAMVGTVDASRALEGGVDLFGVAHPTVKGGKGPYIALQYMLFYAYNPFTLDNHEGDWEGGAVFVDRTTGNVVALYTDRHATSDEFKLPSLQGDGAVSAKDPSAESPTYNVCSSSSSGAMSGIRFWDFDGPRRHPVLYVSSGSHSSYAYPGATKITGAGCIEKTIIRDVHNGGGPKLVPFANAYAVDWNKGAALLPVDKGVTIRNLGEPGNLREAWSAFAGQWGCTYESIPKSYPGPWDNQRLCRHWLTNAWGASLPFILPAKTACTDGP